MLSKLLVFLLNVGVLLLSSSCCVGKEKGTSVFRFANMYGDHMVLQMKPFSSVLWGLGEIGQDVYVAVKDVFHKTKVEEGPGGLGRWKVVLEPQDAGGPHNIVASSKVGNASVNITLDDVLFGDVWLCSGQSNMVFTISQVVNVSKEAKEADNYPEIRLFTAGEIAATNPIYELEKIDQPWSVASAKNVNGGVWKYFSAVCWYYGKNLYDQYKRPIGLIATTYGGTAIEPWSSPDSLRQCNNTGKDVKYVYQSPEELKWFGPSPGKPSELYNAMIHPFLNMTVYGVIWYQGETNAYPPYVPLSYSCTFPAMIDDWRSKWFDGTGQLTDPVFPFGFVQLSSKEDKGDFPTIRWAQTALYGYVPNFRQRNVFMAVAIDLGNASAPFGSVHPPDKHDVGYRLALAGRAVAYNEQDVYYSGPIVSEVVFPQQNETVPWQAQVVYKKETVGKGGIELRAVNGFELFCVVDVGPSRDNVMLEATISHADFNSVYLQGQCPSKFVIKGIRYAWRMFPCSFKHCAVYSKENGLPTPPFIWNAPYN